MTIQAPALRHHPIRYSVTIRLATRVDLDLEGRTVDVETRDTRSVAEALATCKFVELPKKASDVNVHQERLTRIVEMEDLQAPNIRLHHFDPRDYFDSQQVNAMNELAGRTHLKSRMNTYQAYGSLRGFISEIRSLGLSDPVVRPEVDVKELLKHFWSSYPITTSYLYVKVSRLKDAMSQIYTNLQEIKESVQSDSMHHVFLLVQPMLQFENFGKLNSTSPVYRLFRIKLSFDGKLSVNTRHLHTLQIRKKLTYFGVRSVSVLVHLPFNIQSSSVYLFIAAAAV
ncbi:hypothetical protein L2E82_38583 [Cichorium intybus]|uniref:Uncharacterized protein n=1 Tax=Cichorium intybus TaxID=13427 RepID=A0ACB9AGH9_CICIN|nr:hypothetical protein L2E82_38583 [Cichorium intybus]